MGLWGQYQEGLTVRENSQCRVGRLYVASHTNIGSPKRKWYFFSSLFHLLLVRISVLLLLPLASFTDFEIQFLQHFGMSSSQEDFQVSSSSSAPNWDFWSIWFVTWIVTVFFQPLYSMQSVTAEPSSTSFINCSMCTFFPFCFSRDPQYNN